MRLLLDTHTFIWWDSNPAQLSAVALAALRDPANSVWLSVVSVWEILIKAQLGKLSVRVPLPDIVAQQQANGLQVLPVTSPHSLALEGLPPIHKDPFDRLLIAQAIVEGAELISAGSSIRPVSSPVVVVTEVVLSSLSVGLPTMSPEQAIEYAGRKAAESNWPWCPANASAKRRRFWPFPESWMLSPELTVMAPWPRSVCRRGLAMSLSTQCGCCTRRVGGRVLL